MSSSCRQRVGVNRDTRGSRGQGEEDPASGEALEKSPDQLALSRLSQQQCPCRRRLGRLSSGQRCTWLASRPSPVWNRPSVRAVRLGSTTPGRRKAASRWGEGLRDIVRWGSGVRGSVCLVCVDFKDTILGEDSKPMSGLCRLTPSRECWNSRGEFGS